MTNNSLQFDEARHLYTLDGIPITGATTILGMIAKPQLIAWAANQAVDHIKNSVVDIDDEGFLKIPEYALEEARKAHVRKTDAAADTGTEFHLWAETWIKAHIQNNVL